MKSSSVERASAWTGEVCPSEFGRVAMAIDEGEAAGWGRFGGLSDGDTAAVAGFECSLQRHRPKTAADWEWLAKRLGWAVQNDWEWGFVNALLRLAGIAA